MKRLRLCKSMRISRDAWVERKLPFGDVGAAVDQEQSLRMTC